MTRREFFFRTVFCWSVLASHSSRAESSDPPWLDALMARLARIPERRAIFEEVRQFGALNSPLRSRGTLYYRRPDHLEKITVAPRSEKLVVDGDTLTITPPDGFPREIALDSQPEAAVFVDAIRAPLSGNLAALRQHYVVAATGNPADWHLDLTPIDQKNRDLLRGLAIDGEDTVVNTISIILANGDSQRMTIRDAP